jgi:hypothetical protein
MLRFLVVLAVTATAALTTAPGLAGAAPEGDGVLCSYTMSDPHVVDVSGTQMVSATLTPSGCSDSAKPINSQVCLTTANNAGRCAELPGYATAHTYLSPYVPGQSYTATGRGCAARTQTPAVVCSSVGPQTATL